MNSSNKPRRNKRNAPVRRIAPFNTSQRPIPPPRDPVFAVTRMLDNGILTSSTVADIFPAYNYALQYLTSYSEFTALFDQYRIVRVETTFMPTITEISALGTFVNSYLLTAIDYDDSNTYTTVNDALQVATASITPLTKQVVRGFTPRCAIAAYSGTFTSYAQAPTMQWVDCASPGVQHYGLKTAIPLTGSTQTWRVMHRYFLEFRRVR